MFIGKPARYMKLDKSADNYLNVPRDHTYRSLAPGLEEPHPECLTELTLRASISFDFTFWDRNISIWDSG
jgi:hypothetical protein